MHDHMTRYVYWIRYLVRSVNMIDRTNGGRFDYRPRILRGGIDGPGVSIEGKTSAQHYILVLSTEYGHSLLHILSTAPLLHAQHSRADTLVCEYLLLVTAFFSLRTSCATLTEYLVKPLDHPPTDLGACTSLVEELKEMCEGSDDGDGVDETGDDAEQDFALEKQRFDGLLVLSEGDHLGACVGLYGLFAPLILRPQGLE